MSFMNRMERRFRRFCIPNLTLIIVFGQVAAFLAIQSNPKLLDRFVLTGDLVLEGQAWRLVTFVFMPPDTHVFFLFFALYLFYLMGNALEVTWGTFRYDLFLLTGYLATISVAFMFPSLPLANLFWLESVFLAFAILYPDFSLMIMFLLPVKVKWLALVAWIHMGIEFINGPWVIRFAVVAGVLNFFLFFGSELLRRIKRGKRKMSAAASKLASKDEPFHKCHVCGITDHSHPNAEFRYCSQCSGNLCYCDEHIRSHEHVIE